MKEIDWAAMRNEYISQQTSYRKMAEKYGISLNTVFERASKEGWTALRKQTTEKALTKAVEKVAERNVKYFTLCDRLMAKITEFINEAEKLTTTDFKNLTGAIKDLQQCQGIKSERDIREQEARIAKMRKEYEDREKTDREIVVRIADDLKEYGE